MPNIEPEIEKSMKWENPSTSKGKNTFPIGPIKWEKGDNGEMIAMGVGSENGQPRKKVIFTIPEPVGWGSGRIPVANTPAFEKGDPLTTVGTATHPLDTDDAESETPPSDSPPASETTSLAATKSPIQTELPIREGTSETRYKQQSQTHAHGQLADGTPEAAVNDHGHGDKSVTMEPNTVGQAPKEKPLPEPEQPAAPGYVDQAKQAAAAATATVTSTLGSVVGAVTGSGKTEPEKKIEEPERAKSPQEQLLEQKIDAIQDKNVEALLREKHTST